MTRLEALAKAGETMFGGSKMWRTPLADKIGISQRTMFRYLSGEGEVSDDAMSALTAALITEAERLRTVEISAVQTRANDLISLAHKVLVCRLETEDRAKRVSGGVA